MHNIAQCTSEHEPTRRLSAGRLGWWGGAGQPIIGSSSSLALHTCAISQRSLLRQPHRPCPCLRHHQVHVWQEVHVNHLQLANLSWRHCHQHFWDHLVLHLDRSPMIGSPPFLLWALPFFLFSLPAAFWGQNYKNQHPEENLNGDKNQEWARFWEAAESSRTNFFIDVVFGARPNGILWLKYLIQKLPPNQYTVCNKTHHNFVIFS